MLLKISHSITPLFLYIKLYHKFPVFSIMRMENHQYAQEKISCLFITAKPLYLSYAKANNFRSIRHINSLKTPLQAQLFRWSTDALLKIRLKKLRFLDSSSFSYIAHFLPLWQARYGHSGERLSSSYVYFPVLQ